MVVHPQGGIEKVLVVGHVTEGYWSGRGHEQSAFGSFGSASFGLQWQGLKDPKSTTVDFD
jgi:hypothetical protein